ncbi:MAG: DUF86 domain-containing protein [Coriobacteriia bacterium]|nr:DUF86 domain-containing protein [Coriobacteriia bacterium]
MRDPRACVADIVTFSRRALEYVEGVDRDRFLAETGVQDQVIRCLEVIGEAARRTPEETRAVYPGVPWAQMAGLRNRLAHEYDAVDMESVWLTVTRDLPEVLDHLGV